MVSIFLRSLVYNVLFYLLLVFWVIVGIPTFLMPRWAILNVARYWARSSIWLMRVICNTKVEYRGLEKIPKSALIVGSKDRWMWETFALLQFFDQPLFIVKRELMWIPFFGWYLKKSNMIGIDRSAGGRSLLQMARRASEAVRRGRQLVIFPEGTRTPVGAPPHYKTGIAQIYVGCGVTCLPVALNSGLFWPRRTFMRYPGTLMVEFLDPLPPGLSRREFIARISTVIEEASNRLVETARRELVQLLIAKTLRLDRPHGGQHIVAIVAGTAVALLHVAELFGQRQPPGILHVAAIDHVSQRADALPGFVFQPHRPHHLAIDVGGLLAAAPEHQAGLFRRAAMIERIDAKRAMLADQPRRDLLDEVEARAPHQRAIAEHPEVAFGFRLERDFRWHRLHGYQKKV